MCIKQIKNWTQLYLFLSLSLSLTVLYPLTFHICLLLLYFIIDCTWPHDYTPSSWYLSMTLTKFDLMIKYWLNCFYAERIRQGDPVKSSFFICLHLIGIKSCQTKAIILWFTSYIMRDSRVWLPWIFSSSPSSTSGLCNVLIQVSSWKSSGLSKSFPSASASEHSVTDYKATHTYIFLIC